MASQSDDGQKAGRVAKPISREQAERNMYGGMTSSQLLGGDKDWLSALGAYDGPYGTGGNDERIPNYQAPIRQVVVDGGDVNQRLNAIFGLTPKSIGSPQASNDIVAQQMSDLGAGIWDGVKALPRGIWNGVATIADGYRGLAYLATGNINSFRPRSNVTLDGIARGIVDNSPVGVLGAMFDNNYRAAGGRFVGTVAGLGASYASPYLTKIPGLNYDIGAASARGLYSVGEYAAGKLDAMLDRSGLRMYAVPADAKWKIGTISLVDSEIGALNRIAANNAIDTGSAARMARIDELATSNYNRLLTRDLGTQGYVYRGVNANMIDIYEAQGGIAGRGGSPTYFSLDVGSTGSEHMLGAQMPNSPEVMLRIPTSALLEPTVPRPNWGNATSGREYYTNSYPNWGYGGYRQFVGTTSSFSRDWIVPGWRN